MTQSTRVIPIIPLKFKNFLNIFTLIQSLDQKLDIINLPIN
jgi:hypothetical protein